MKNQPSIYLNSSFDYETKGLTGRWIDVPVSNEAILNIINDLKVNEDDTVIILDHEHMYGNINEYSNVPFIATVHAEIAKRVNERIDAIKDVEFVDNAKVINLKMDIIDYILTEIEPCETKDNVIQAIDNLTIELETANNDNILYNFGYEIANQTFNTENLPDIIKNNINYENIGRDEVINNPDIITYGGFLEDSHLTYLVY